MSPLEFVVTGVPVSVQASPPSKKGWKVRVAAAAQVAVVAGESPVSHNVHVQVVYYYTGAPLDTDNMLKPILDAMSAIVYEDDDQVTDIRAAKRDLAGSFRVRGVSSTLIAGLSTNTDFVHVRVQDAPDPQELL